MGRWLRGNDRRVQKVFRSEQETQEQQEKEGEETDSATQGERGVSPAALISYGGDFDVIDGGIGRNANT
jgi:hypothetical protein